MFRPGSPLAGQPRPVDDAARRPSAAERARTLVESNASALLTIPGAQAAAHAAAGDRCAEPEPSVVETRAVDTDGSVLLLVSAGSPAARALAGEPGADPVAVLDITDVAPVAVPHRVRGHCQVTGWLSAVPAGRRPAAEALLAPWRLGAAWEGDRALEVLRLEPAEAMAEDLWGTGCVEPEEFAAARPDPLARHEAGLLQHLAAMHREELYGLCPAETGDGTCEGAWDRLEPLSLDRFGLRLRCWREDGSGCDVRFAFPSPANELEGVQTRLRGLLTAAGSDHG